MNIIYTGHINTLLRNNYHTPEEWLVSVFDHFLELVDVHTEPHFFVGIVMNLPRTPLYAVQNQCI